VTDTPTPSDSPIFTLLTELVARDEARQAMLEAIREKMLEFMEEQSTAMVELRSMLRDAKSSQLRQEVMEREVRNELLRQDQQLQGFDRRISGNYMGVSAQLDVIGEEMREQRASIGNMERAVVESSKDMKRLQGRFIELSGDSRERFGKLERALPALSERLQQIESSRQVSEDVGAGETSGGVLGRAEGGGG